MWRAGNRAWWVIGLGLGAIGAVLLADTLGWLGPLVVCGADGAAVCVDWPGLAAWATWLLFFGVMAGLGAWQVRQWRADPTPSSGEPSAKPSHDA